MEAVEEVLVPVGLLVGTAGLVAHLAEQAVGAAQGETVARRLEVEAQGLEER